MELSPDIARDVRTVAKGGGVQIVGHVIHAGMSLVFTFVAVRVLGTAGFGVYRQVAQVLMVASQIAHGGFNFSAMHFIARARAAGDYGRVLGVARISLVGAGIASLIVLVGLLVGSDQLAALFSGPGQNREELSDLFRLGSPYVVLGGFMSVICYCTLGYKTVTPAVIAANVVQPLARFVLGVAALLAGFGVAGAVSTLWLGMAFGVLAAGWYFRRMLTPAERHARPHADVRPMIRFALLQAGIYLLDFQTLGLGIIVLGVVSGDRQVGLFAIALSLQAPGQLIQIAIANIWNPVISDLHERGDRARLQSLIQTINRWIATFSLPVFALLIIDGDLLYGLFTGRHDLTAAAVIATLAIGNLAYTAGGATAQVISMTGRPGINFMNSIVAVSAYVLFGALIVPRHGAVGMAVVDATVLVGVTVARIVQASIVTGLRPFGRSFLKPVLASLGGATLLLLWDALPIESVSFEITGILAAGAAYLLVLRALGMDEEERHVLERIRARALKR